MLASSFLCNFIAEAQVINLPVRLEIPESIKSPETITICITGDMMMHSRQLDYGFDSYFTKIGSTYLGADLTIANMEFTLAGEPYSGYPQFSAPDRYAEAIAESGVDVFLCANNHILDKGSEGAGRTLAQYRSLEEKYGVRFTGAAGSCEELEATTPLVISCKGTDIALINFTYGTNLGSTDHWPRINYMRQKEFLKTALHRADSLADFTIVLPHWGEEYRLIHSEDQESTARWLIDNGADLIVGTHPHVVQDIGTIDGVKVAYSLGNAVSNMSAQNTQLGLTLKVRLTVGTNGKVRLEGLEPIYTWCSRPGGYENGYVIIPVEEYIGRRTEWAGEWDYDKMITTYERVRDIHDNEQ